MTDIADRLGSDFADRLVEAFGGLRIYVPFRKTTRGRLFKVFSESEISSLAEVCGGTHISVPVGRGNAFGRARRRAEAMIREGLPAHQIANRVGVSVRSVFYIKRDMRDGAARGGQE